MFQRIFRRFPTTPAVAKVILKHIPVKLRRGRHEDELATLNFFADWCKALGIKYDPEADQFSAKDGATLVHLVDNWTDNEIRFYSGGINMGVEPAIDIMRELAGTLLPALDNDESLLAPTRKALGRFIPKNPVACAELLAGCLRTAVGPHSQLRFEVELPRLQAYANVSPVAAALMRDRWFDTTGMGPDKCVILANGEWLNLDGDSVNPGALSGFTDPAYIQGVHPHAAQMAAEYKLAVYDLPELPKPLPFQFVDASLMYSFICQFILMGAM